MMVNECKEISKILRRIDTMCMNLSSQMYIGFNDTVVHLPYGELYRSSSMRPNTIKSQ